jgi:hypothetical protein
MERTADRPDRFTLEAEFQSCSGGTLPVLSRPVAHLASAHFRALTENRRDS